ncbi:MAG: hypothetical protein BIFFINMI_00666 [Phycisphaerae bacterium]|nr:hypothetical protein [Phycisphaerae bacterium]
MPRPAGRLMIACLLASWTPAGMASAGADDGEFYRSDFAALPDGPAPPAHWRLAEGICRIVGGRLHIASDRSNPRAILDVACPGDATWRATLHGAGRNHHVGLLARGVYCLQTNRQFSRLELLRLTGGQSKVVASAPRYWIYARAGDRLELRLVVVGRRVRGFVDDKLLIDWEDPDAPPAGGQFGLLGGWGTDLGVSNVSLTSRPDLSQWPVGQPPAAAPAGLVRVVSVDRMCDGNVYFDRGQPKLAFRLTTDRPLPAAVRLTCRLIDVREKVVAERTFDAKLSRGAQTPAEVAFDPLGRGCFKIALHVNAGDAGGGWVEDLASFVVVSKALADRPADPRSYFGGHMDGINLDWHLSAGRSIGIRWARCHDMLQYTWWTRVQPTGRDDWQFGDAAQRSVDAAGMSTLGEFLWTPRWASTQPDDRNFAAFPPRDAADFARYVRTLVERQRGSIRCWEVWNEPHYSGFWRGSPADYARLLKVAYDAARRADPRCTVIGGGGLDLDSRDWIVRMLDALDGRPMDAISIHYLDPDAGSEQLAWFRGVLDAHGLKDMPIWNTEASVLSTSFLDQDRAGLFEPEARFHFRNACCELVRMYMTNLSNGVTRVFYYHQADPWRFRAFAKPRVLEPPPIEAGMWDEARAFKPLASAHAALALAIDGKAFKRRTDRGPFQAHLFADDSSATAVCYTMLPHFADRLAGRATLPAGLDAGRLTIMDFMGNESAAKPTGGRLPLVLSREPFYLTCRGDDATGQLSRLVESVEAPPAGE